MLKFAPSCTIAGGFNCWLQLLFSIEIIWLVTQSLSHACVTPDRQSKTVPLCSPFLACTHITKACWAWAWLSLLHMSWYCNVTHTCLYIILKHPKGSTQLISSPFVQMQPSHIPKFNNYAKVANVSYSCCTHIKIFTQSVGDIRPPWTLCRCCCYDSREEYLHWSHAMSMLHTCSFAWAKPCRSAAPTNSAGVQEFYCAWVQYVACQ